MGTIAQALEQCDRARRRAFAWRDALSVEAKLGLALGMAVATGLAAQFRIPLPHTPVPVTGQVFAVLLAGVLLGAGWGTLSMGLYLGLGIAGVPWFAGCTSTMGVTVGYLIGFVVAAFLIGWVTDRWPGARHPLLIIFVMLLGVGVIYLLGALAFAAILRTNLQATLAQAVMPFIVWDVAKALVAAGVAGAILPKDS